jgi:GT2 family glycosyltransferase
VEDADLPLDVLVPTYRRPAALAVTLAGLASQTLPRFRVVVSDQTEDGAALAGGEVQTVVRLLRARGRPVDLHVHRPRRGLAEHRQFLLDRATAPYALFLDDDVFCEPDVLARLLRVLRGQGCGFVGMPLVGLTHLDDVRPHQQAIELWEGPVEPEPFGPDDVRWQRHHLHSAANAWHVQERLGATDPEPLLYKVAWVGGCVLYDVEKLRAAGGFGFWTELPPDHCGEDVLAQSRVRGKFGGCGVLPTGAFHQQLPTTVEDRTVDAPFVLPLATTRATSTLPRDLAELPGHRLHPPS